MKICEQVDGGLQRLNDLWLKTRKYVISVGFVLLLVLAVTVTVRFYLNEDHPLEAPQVEEPKTNCTLVTAFFGLGPSDSPAFANNLRRYHSQLALVLQLRLPLVMFTNEHSAEFAMSTRQAARLENLTRVHNVTLEALPLTKHYALFGDIIADEQHGKAWKSQWNVGLRDRPEMASVEYMILENSKSYFLSNVSREDPFNTSSCFVWIDANYGQGEPTVFPRNFDWSPEIPQGKVSLLKLTPTNDSITLYNKEKLYRQNITLLGGEFMAADGPTTHKFHKIYEKKVLDLALNDRMLDDDETMLVILVNEWPNMFNIVQGEWFNAFHLF